jgi:flagellar basal-body rod modification protein FlgD
MTQIPSTLSGAGSQSGGQLSNKTLGGLDMDQFLGLMIAELQNQDPLNPLENHQLLAQISQIREVGATDRLTDTLDSVLLGQNVSNATNLIGKEVKAITTDGKSVQGVVDRVTIIDGSPTIHVGEDSVPITNVSEVRSEVRSEVES